MVEWFWDFVFEQADHGHLPDDMIKVDMEGRVRMNGRWYRRAGNFRSFVEPLARVNLAYIDVNAVYSNFRPGRFLRIEHTRYASTLNANAVPERNAERIRGSGARYA